MKDRRIIKNSLPDNVHLMNKSEAKALRQLRAKFKASELEIRLDKKKRKVLSEAQDAGEKPLSWIQKDEKRRQRILKSLTKKYKLPKEHEFIQKQFKEIYYVR